MWIVPSAALTDIPKPPSIPGVVAEIVTLLLLNPTLMIPSPDTTRVFENTPVELGSVLTPMAVRFTEPAAAAGAEMETVLPLIPMETTPIPEKASRLLTVPVELLNVFAPDAVREMLDVCTLAEIVMVLAPVERAMPPPAERTIVPVEDAKPFAEMAFSPLTEIVMEPAAVAVCRLMFAPAAMARDNALPAMDVPEAEMVFVPATPLAEIVIVLAPVERAIPGPAERTIVPVLEANPLADKAFKPLTEMVMSCAAVAV